MYASCLFVADEEEDAVDVVGDGPSVVLSVGPREVFLAIPEGVKIFTLKTPTLIIKEYILSRFKEEHGPYKGTGNEI